MATEVFIGRISLSSSKDPFWAHVRNEPFHVRSLFYTDKKIFSDPAFASLRFIRHVSSLWDFQCCGDTQEIHMNTRQKSSSVLATPQLAIDISRWFWSPCLQAIFSVQENRRSKTNSTATKPVLGPDWWYCHMCRNGPQSIHTPSCTNVTASGICGHQRCYYCTTE